MEIIKALRRMSLESGLIKAGFRKIATVGNNEDLLKVIQECYLDDFRSGRHLTQGGNVSYNIDLFVWEHEIKNVKKCGDYRYSVYIKYKETL